MEEWYRSDALVPIAVSFAAASFSSTTFSPATTAFFVLAATSAAFSIQTPFGQPSMNEGGSTLNGVHDFFGFLLSVVSDNFGIVFQFHGFLCMNQCVRAYDRAAGVDHLP